MRPYYLLDTNIISEPTQKVQNKNVINNLRDKVAVCAISAITLAEVAKGAYLLPPGKRQDSFIEFYNEEVKALYQCIPFDEFSAQIYGEIQADMIHKGRPRPQLDLLIAATAIANNMILVTRNTADFEDIPGLMMENWFEES